MPVGESRFMEPLQLAGRLIMENGGETYRVEETITRMGRAFGLDHVESFAVPSGLFVSYRRADGDTETAVMRVRKGSTNLSRVDAVNAVSRQVEHGDLTPDEARRHPNRNLITRALGPDAVAQTDGFKVPWKKGDFLLLCSDGLVNTVTDQEILFEMIHNDQLDSCLDRLMTVSKGRGAPDNVTAVLLMNI